MSRLGIRPATSAWAILRPLRASLRASQNGFKEGQKVWEIASIWPCNQFVYMVRKTTAPPERVTFASTLWR